MQPIFTMQYGEFAVADYFEKHKKELHGVSVFVPASAQEKGIDLLLYRHDREKQKPAALTVQVKMSRTYMGYKTKSGLPFSLWFNRYPVQENADWYVLVGIYAKQPEEAENSNELSKTWHTIMLAFTREEMAQFMSEVKQKKKPTKDDTMFGFEYEPASDRKKSKIVQSRGYFEPRDMSKYLIENRLEEISNTFR